MTKTTKKMVYTILETQTTSEGEYIPCIVKEGESGYYLTDWAWGTDIEVARELADKRNETMGIDKKEANKIILQSMSK